MMGRVKVVVLGPADAGKTSLVQRLLEGEFHETLPTSGTIYSSFYNKQFNTTLQLWDTAGQERYRSVSRMFYRNGRVFLMVLDCSTSCLEIQAREYLNEIEMQSGAV